MRKRNLLIAALCIILVFLNSCEVIQPGDPGTNVPEEPTATVPAPDASGTAEPETSGSGTGTLPTEEKLILNALFPRVSVRDRDLESFDYTTLFTILKNGTPVPVEASFLDTSRLRPIPGDYAVVCSYGGKQATVVIRVEKTAYTVSVAQGSVTLKQSECGSYDFLALFSATADGEAVALGQENVSTDLSENVGDYFYTVTVGDASATLSVRVTPDHLLEVFPCYRSADLTADQLSGMDHTSLFTLYVDGAPVRVTEDMIRVSGPQDPEIGSEYTVEFCYRVGLTECRSSIRLTVVPEEETVIVGKNVVTYPNGQIIDPVTLFTITKGDLSVPVTRDMIEGEVDYTAKGVYTLTLTYEGKTAEATVEIRGGVVIRPATADVITVTVGTDVDTYPFERDFFVIINGVRFADIPMSCFDLSGVDFSRPGEYPVTLTILYNDQKPSGLTQKVKFTEYRQTVTYLVTENTYSVSVVSDPLVLPKGTTSYDVFRNLAVVINNRKQTLTDNPAYADLISCYAQVISGPVDFSSAQTQKVRVAVYINGPAAEPLIVEYDLRVESDVTVEVAEAAIFEGQPLYVKNLFTVLKAGTPMEVTYDMITGRVDIFTPGVYEVTIDYEGIVKTARVIVLNGEIPGTYHTALTTIAKSASADEEGYEEEAIPADVLGDLIIRPDGTVRVNGRDASIRSAVDPNTLILSSGSNLYTLSYEDGIAVLNPDNSIKLGFSDYRRPLIYFHEDKWDLVGKVVVNSSASGYVLELTSTSYSVDTFHIRSKDGSGREQWYGLMVRLAEKTSADTVYAVTWGQVAFAEDFLPQSGVASSMEFNGDTYRFTMTSAGTAKINVQEAERLWKNRRFTGTVNGMNAVLSTNQYEHYTLTVNGKKVFEFNPSLTNGMRNGSIDYENGILFVYDITGDDFERCSYHFLINDQENTFTLCDHDPYYGYYVYGNMYLFLDGYGSGRMSFNRGNYATTPVTYTVRGQELEVCYHPTTVSFEYGEYATYYIDTLLNVLTVREFPGAKISGETFVNEMISDGAIVNIPSCVAVLNGREQFLSRITIVTKDGVLSDAEKAKCVSFETVKFSQEGFYRFTVTVKVGGRDVVSEYTVLVLASAYAGNPLAVSYGKGVLNNTIALSLDQYGQTTLVIGNTVYSGFAQLGEASFTARVYDANRALITLQGALLAEGIVQVKAVGAVNFTEVFTSGVSRRAIGMKGLTLRAITVNGTTTYFASPFASSIGSFADVTAESGTIYTTGSILRITTAESEVPVYVMVVAWDDLSGGLLASDGFRGTYTSSGGDTLTLNGFGTAVCNGTNAKYRLKGSVATLTTEENALYVFRMNAETLTCERIPVDLNATSLNGKTYQATHSFSCGYYSYTALTTFTFSGDGTVTVVSVSESHDAGGDACGDDLYAPSYASASGKTGTFTVSGDAVTVSVEGETFLFRISDVLTCSDLVCESTTVASGAHGYFRPGTTFYN